MGIAYYEGFFKQVRYKTNSNSDCSIHNMIIAFIKSNQL